MTYGAVAYASGGFGGLGAAAAAAGTFPIRSLEFAFDSDPGDEEPIWTDATEYARFVSSARGRSRELDAIQPGHMSVPLSNLDRRFDPTNAAGPHVGKIRPRKKIRFRATYAGVTYPVFDGYVDSWGSQYEKPHEASVTVSATDGFKVLAGKDLATSAYAQEVTADAPVAWWRMGEAVGATSAIDSAGSFDLARTGTAANVTFGQSGLPFGEADGAVRLIDDGTAEKEGFIRFGAPLIATAPMTIELLFKYVGPDEVGNLLAQFTADGPTAGGFQLETIFGDLVRVVAANSVGVTSATGTTTLAIGTTLHLAATWASDGAVRLYINGIEEAATVLGVGVFPGSEHAMAIGGARAAAGNQGNTDGIYDEVAVYDYALSAARIAAHAAAVATPWVGDSPGARLDRVLDHVGWAEGLRELDTGASVLQAADLDGVTALAHAQKVSDSEFGELFITRGGSVRLVERGNLINLDVSATFGDTGADHRYSSIEFDFSDQLIRNAITIARENGVPQSATDDASIDAYFTLDYDRTGLLHDSDTVSRHAAEFFLSEYKDALLRITSITIEPGRSPATLFPEVLGRELGDYVTVKLTPPGGGAQIEQASRIEGISHSVAPKHWRTTWQLSPAYAGTNFFELDDGNGSAPSGLDDAALYF